MHVRRHDTVSARCRGTPGFRTVAQVEENAGALRYGPLTASQLTEIDWLLEREVVEVAP